VETYWQGKTKVLREKASPVSLYSPQILYVAGLGLNPDLHDDRMATNCLSLDPWHSPLCQRAMRFTTELSLKAETQQASETFRLLIN
jgi:hypothetical protein